MRTKVTIIALALTLAVPTIAIAGWGGKGSAEPDTKLDVTGGWMFLTADQGAAGEKVYFNGFTGAVIGYYPTSVQSSVNPNVATVGSGIPTFPDSPKALLGAWKDCNKDTYVGLGDHGLFEYRAELLLDTSVCPKVVPPTPIPNGWMPVHNDGTWVHEWLAIGPENGNVALPDPMPWNVRDEGARVWVDDGLPGAAPYGTCYTTAHPMGTYHSVGGIVNLSDCYLTGRVDSTGNLAACTTGSCGTWTTIKATQNPWGAENGASDLNAWDCGNTLATAPVVATVHLVIHAPRVPPTTSTSGSLGGTANATGSGVTPDCIANYHGDQTNAGQVIAHAPYTTESDATNNMVSYRVAPDFTLTFNEGRGGRPAPLVGASLGKGSPGDGGLGEDVYNRGYWNTGSVRAVSRNPIVDRTLIAAQKVTIYTSYAFVSPTAITDYSLRLPKGTATGLYGQEACGGATFGIVNSWQCDPAAWYPSGPASVPRDLNLGPGPDGFGVMIGARVGDLYNMRDIDCYDFSVAAARQQGIGYGVLTSTKCTPP